MKKQTLLLVLNAVTCCLLVVILGFTLYDFAQPTAENIFQENLRTVVELKAFDDEETVSYGSAVCIDKDGTFITNSHVVSYKNNAADKQFDTIQVRFSAAEDYVNAELLKIDYEKDLALIKIDTANNKVRPAKIRYSVLKEGETIYAIGNAQNYGISIINGIISQTELNVQADGKTVAAIQCALNITDGNSGGALLDVKGSLIGLTTFRLKDKSNNIIYGTSFAIPAKIISEFIER